MDPLIDNTINRVWENVSVESDIYLTLSTSLDLASSGTQLTAKDFEHMWNRAFPQRDVVAWSEFREEFLKFLGIKLNLFDVRLQFLKRFLKVPIDQGKSQQRQPEIVDREHALQLWDFFCPIFYGHDIIKKINELAINSWFYICSKDWIPKILEEKPPNRKYLVRLGDSKGTFDVVHQDNQGIQHHELRRCPSNGKLQYRGQEYSSIEDFLQNKLDLVISSKMQQRFVDN